MNVENQWDKKETLGSEVSILNMFHYYIIPLNGEPSYSGL